MEDQPQGEETTKTVVHGSMDIKQQRPEKLSYEELEKFASQAAQQIEHYKREYQKVQYGNMIQRLGFLFEVVRSSEKFSTPFVAKCVREIELSNMQKIL